MGDLIEFMARHLVSLPDEVQVDRVNRGRVTVYELSVAQEDMGRVIGRQGRMAAAMRQLIRAAPINEGRKCVLEIVESN